MQPIVTLTTDFGLSDHFVGAMKGVMLSINPAVRFVDISHQVKSYDILEGAFTLAEACRYFPPQAIHLVVIDPGVGSSRRPIIVSTRQHRFVAADNGVLSFIYAREEMVEVRHVTAENYFLKPVSSTFHGRDIFAPVAAWLSKGVDPAGFGETITDYIKLPPATLRRLDGNLVQGAIIKVDKFGNLITNLGPDAAPELFSRGQSQFRIMVSGQEVTQLYTSYSMGKPGELFCIVGSSGFIEIAQNQGSAAEALHASRGTEVKVILIRP